MTLVTEGAAVQIAVCSLLLGLSLQVLGLVDAIFKLNV